MKRVLTCLGVVFSVGFAGVFGISQAAMASTVKIVVEGAVSCNYHPLSGVWVQSSGGGSGWAHWNWGSNGEYDGVFSLTIATAPQTNLSLHIGCGTGSTPGSWWSDNYTPAISVSSSVVLQYSCNEGNGATAPAPGIRCSAGATRSEQAAINWAKSYLNSSSYYDLCLKFVSNAYAAANVTLQNFVVPQMNNSTYPQFIWRQFKQLQQYIVGGPGITPQPVTAQSGIYGGPETVPPAGALVFFNQVGAHDGNSQASGVFSHITLSLGGSNMISTGDNTTADPGWTVIHDETLAQHQASGAWNTYVGWWLPA